MLLFKPAMKKAMDNEFRVEVVVDEGHADYVYSLSSFTKEGFHEEVQAYLWYIFHNRDLENLRGNIQKYLEANGHDADKENRVSPDYYDSDAEYFAERFDERLGDVLDLNNASEYSGYLYGHTVKSITVEYVENGEVIEWIPELYSEETEKKVLELLVENIVY